MPWNGNTEGSNKPCQGTGFTLQEKLSNMMSRHAKDPQPPKRGKHNDLMINGIIIVVTLVWVVNFGARFFVDNYQPQESLNAIFMGIVGGLVAYRSRGGG